MKALSIILGVLMVIGGVFCVADSAMTFAVLLAVLALFVLIVEPINMVPLAAGRFLAVLSRPRLVCLSFFPAERYFSPIPFSHI